MLFAWMRNVGGLLGLVGGAALWALSGWALTLAMRANLAASALGRARGDGSVLDHLHGTAVLWSLGFTGLQLTSFLVFTFVLRACYRLRSAVCFAMGGGFVMLGDVAGLFALLVWLRMTEGVG